MKTITESIKQKAEKLKEKKYHNSLMVALWLHEKVTSKSSSLLLSSGQELLKPEQQKQLDLFLQKLIHEDYPLQYILETVPFGPLELNIKEPILIPRPETEEWVNTLIDQLAPFKNEPLTILDLCCGSGCIGLWLAKVFPNFNIIATDINPQAVKLTIQNAHKNNIKNMTAIESDLFKNITHKKFDLILSNPPYITEKEFATLEKNVTKWEDKRALVAKNNGLFFYEHIAQQAGQFLKQESPLKNNGPRLVVEIGHLQGKAVAKIFEKNGFKASLGKDYTGKDRTVSAL